MLKLDDPGIEVDVWDRRGRPEDLRIRDRNHEQDDDGDVKDEGAPPAADRPDPFRGEERRSRDCRSHRERDDSERPSGGQAHKRRKHEDRRGERQSRAKARESVQRRPLPSTGTPDGGEADRPPHEHGGEQDAQASSPWQLGRDSNGDDRHHQARHQDGRQCLERGSVRPPGEPVGEPRDGNHRCRQDDKEAEQVERGLDALVLLIDELARERAQVSVVRMYEQQRDGDQREDEGSRQNRRQGENRAIARAPLRSRLGRSPPAPGRRRSGSRSVNPSGITGSLSRTPRRASAECPDSGARRARGTAAGMRRRSGRMQSTAPPRVWRDDEHPVSVRRGNRPRDAGRRRNKRIKHRERMVALGG